MPTTRKLPSLYNDSPKWIPAHKLPGHKGRSNPHEIAYGRLTTLVRGLTGMPGCWAEVTTRPSPNRQELHRRTKYLKDFLATTYNGSMKNFQIYTAEGRIFARYMPPSVVAKYADKTLAKSSV